MLINVQHPDYFHKYVHNIKIVKILIITNQVVVIHLNVYFHFGNEIVIPTTKASDRNNNDHTSTTRKIVLINFEPNNQYEEVIAIYNNLNNVTSIHKKPH